MIKNQRGQVALFVALIFQVLFVFFAMVINIGLLVHHKINLQNSADLAAYYGAMKQAEMLNAIAHVNYQIRQSYKLLMFRYHQIGIAGESDRHPYDWNQRRLRAGSDVDTAPVSFPTAFCAGYAPFSIVGENESYCKSLARTPIPLPGKPDLLGGIGRFGFLLFYNTIQAAADRFNTEARLGCQRIAQLNWFLLAQYITLYKMDMKNRKEVLIALANQLSKDAPRDIEGGSIRQGVYKTLIKNLTSQNLASLKKEAEGENVKTETGSFDFVNSLAEGDCGPASPAEAPKWLSEVSIFNQFVAMSGECEGSDTNVTFKPQEINRGREVDRPPYNTILTPQIVDFLKSYIDEPSGEDPNTRLWKSSLGFEKNPWCMAYVGVKVKTTPKIPFSPLGDVALTAKAYAKPFGGRIGPWYGTTWPAGSDKSSDSRLTDELAPFRVNTAFGDFDLAGLQSRPENARIPTYGRFMGDSVGLRSRMATGQFGKLIHQGGRIESKWWTQALQDEVGSKTSRNTDTLVWDQDSNRPPSFRNIEIAAVAPDQFDVSHYSIEADFFNNYLGKLRRGYGDEFNFKIRGDLGMQETSSDEKIKKFSVKDQIATLYEPTTQTVDTNRMTYLLSDFMALLTSWQGKNHDNYGLDNERFGLCAEKITGENPAETVPGNCRVGGRVGYSVKLVSEDYLKKSDNLELGGEGVFGSLKNKPPDW